MTEIVRFRLITKDQKRPKDHPISLYQQFEAYISIYGCEWIRKIIFYFNVEKYCYPYNHHPIILEYNKGAFDVIFYHFYDGFNRRNELKSEQKIEDYQTLLSFLKQYNSYILSYIQAPTIVTTPTT
jgi:hypothetical protein